MLRYTIALLILLLAAVAQADSHAEWCRAALAKVPVSKRDLGNEARMARRAQQQAEFAEQIARFSKNAPLPPKTWAALLVAIGSIESNYDSEIVDGKCPKWACDIGKARGAFQNHNVKPVAELWLRSEGAPATQVEMADKMLRLTWRRCAAFAPFPASAFRGYGGARSCSWPAPREAERVAMFARIGGGK